MNKLRSVWTGRRIPLDQEMPRVLVVDDNEAAADALVMFFQLEKILACAVYGGEQAIETGHTWNPHLIVMDISMPLLSGYDAARSLRYDHRTNGIAIIAFTALDEAHVRDNLEDHEFDAYCQKGQSPDNLLELLTQMIDAV